MFILINSENLPEWKVDILGMQVNTLIFLSLILGLLALILAAFNFWSLRGLNSLRKNFFSGSNAGDLESVINKLSEGLHTLQDNQVILEKYIKNLRSDYGLAVQKVGIIKFNPFSDGGGSLSFTVAMLDGRNTGMVITSMHGREQNRIYAKQVIEGKCDIQLTQEELGAIEQANNNHKKLISNI